MTRRNPTPSRLFREALQAGCDEARRGLHRGFVVGTFDGRMAKNSRASPPAPAGKARSFHTPEHIFDLVDPSNPHTTLAALFHDLVYYNIGQGFAPQIEEHVRSSIELRDGALWLRSMDPEEDPQPAICGGIFGFEKRLKLSPAGGMNEFLSALVMHRRLVLAPPGCDAPRQLPPAGSELPPEALPCPLHGARRPLPG
jgi:hypothetical protein